MASSKCASKVRRALLLAASAGVLAASQAAMAQTRPTEYTIGTTLPLTGVGAFYGESARNGTALAVKHINAAGGIKGVPLRVIYEDSRLQPKDAVTSLQKLLDVHKVSIVMTAGSPVVLAQAPIARERKILLANLAATSPKLRREGEFLFNFIVLADTEAELLADMVAEQYKEYSVLHVDSDYGMDFVEALTKAMNKKGIKQVSREQHPVGAVDFRTSMIKLKAANAPALINVSNVTETGHVANQLREVGVKSQVFGPTISTSPNNLKIAPEAMNGWRGVMVDFDPGRNDRAKAFAEAYQKEYGSAPNVHSAINYDTTRLIAQAIAAEGNTPEGVRKFLSTEKGLVGVMGDIQFDADRVIRFAPVRWLVKDGKVIPQK